MISIAKIAVTLVVALLLAGGAYLYSVNQPTPGAPATPDTGYYYRQIVRLSLDGEIHELNVVIACNTDLVGRFGGAAAFGGPRFYAERIKNNHAIGLRRTEACDGRVTGDGVPEDLLPHVIWFEDADDLTQGILYASDDAYENPRSQMKFLGSTIQPATREEFAAFFTAKRSVSLVPIDGTRTTPQGVSMDIDLDRLVREGKVPKPNARHAIGFGNGFCKAMIRNELTEEARSGLRLVWPSHRPKFWAQQQMDPVTGNNYRGNIGDTAKSIVTNGRNSRGDTVTAVVDGGKVRDVIWELHLPNDGLPRRHGLGRIGRNPTLLRVRDMYPIAFTSQPNGYSEQDRQGSTLRWKVDFQGGATKGFAYCSPDFAELAGNGSAGSQLRDQLLPGATTRPIEIWIGDDRVDMTLVDPPLTYSRILIELRLHTWVFEEDKAVWVPMFYH